MKIQNLSQLKKAFASGHDFKIIEHFNRPECNGQIRHITKLQTNGFYSVVKDDPDDSWSKANDGLGTWCEFGKAAEWLFVEWADGVWTCTLEGCFEIEVLPKTVWIAELADSDDFETLIGATNEEEAIAEAERTLGDNWLYVHEVEE